MCRRPMFIGSLLLFLASTAVPTRAQERPRFEIGMQAGMSRISDGDSDDALITVGFPAGGRLGMSTVYAVFFTSSNVAFEPRLGFQRSSWGDQSESVVEGAGRIRVFVSDPSEGSMYFFGEGAVVRAFDGSRGESNFAAGGGIGGRKLASPHLSLSLEAGYRRWFSENGDLNEVRLAVGFGAVVGHS